MAKSKQSMLNLNPVPTQKASEAIYEQIADLIMSGQLAPGDRLPSERSMMEMLQRSRPTIREALRMLERSSLIKTIPGSNGAVVLEPSSASVEQPLENMLAMNKISHQELLEMRELLEKSTVEWAVKRRTDEDLAKMKEAISKSRENLTDFDEFVKYDLAFHQSISDAAHNKLAAIVDKVCHRMILDILKTAYERKDEVGKKEMISNIAASHELIYKAIESKDMVLAIDYMTNHIRHFSSDIL